MLCNLIQFPYRLDTHTRTHTQAQANREALCGATSLILLLQGAAKVAAFTLANAQTL